MYIYINTLYLYSYNKITILTATFYCPWATLNSYVKPGSSPVMFKWYRIIPVPTRHGGLARGDNAIHIIASEEGCSDDQPLTLHEHARKMGFYMSKICLSSFRILNIFKNVT
jgi:hypothetical protein